MSAVTEGRPEFALPGLRTEEQRTSIPARRLVQCLVVSSAVWSVLFFFGREISYGGDDSAVLNPLFGGGLLASLYGYIRPLEYWTAVLSSRAGFPVWLVVSSLAYVATSTATLILLKSLPCRELRFWHVLVCACSPLLAQAYFQIDTVSQALANLFSLIFVVISLRCLRATRVGEIRAYSWGMALVALLCILSKETAYGTVFIGVLLAIYFHRNKVLVPAILTLTMLALSVLWIVSHRADVTTANAHYGFKTNPLYCLFAFVYSIVVAAAPVPTSITLTEAFLHEPSLAAVVIAGLLVSVCGLFMLVSSLRAVRFHTVSAALRKENFGVYHILGLFLVFSLIPSMFLKAAELYASQAVPILKVLLIAATPARSRISPKLFWSLCSILWIVASTVNVMYFSVATGFDPQRENGSTHFSWIYSPIQRAVANERRVYSIYFSKVYDDLYLSTNSDGRVCKIDRRQPDVCLPKNISSGFPERI